jgi:hypothetical protein
MAARINGFTVAYTVAGGVILWSGIKGATISNTVRSVVAGNANPAQTEAITGSSSISTTQATDGSGSYQVPPAQADSAVATQNQAVGKLYAATYGWATGAQWNALVALWNRESGWNNLAKNPSSGAFGIAQALGHGGAGYAGTYSDNYPSTSANSGDAGAQIGWGLQYIQQTYGNPVNAWNHEESAGWY